jgi:ABC-type uncharacterized transport system auxiliary subunit
MNAYMRLMAVVALIITLAGCVSAFSPQQQQYHVLDAPVTAGTAEVVPRTSTLLIMPTTVSNFYQSQDIVYSRVPGTRAYYHLHAWTEPPGQRLTELLLLRLDRAGLFRGVVRAGAGVSGEIVLATHLSEFYHDAAIAPGSVLITMTAELTDATRRVLLGRQSFTRMAPVVTYDAPGAVQAFNSAVATLFDDVSAWVDATAPRLARRHARTVRSYLIY